MSNFLLAMSCVIPATASLFLLRKIPVGFRPVVYIIWLAVVTELLMWLAGNNGRYRAHVLNSYLLIELALVLWFLVANKVLSTTAAILTGVVSVLMHVGEITLSGHYVMCMRTSVMETVVMVVGCITLLSRLIFDIRQPLLTDFRFVVLVAMVINGCFDLLNVGVAWIVPVSAVTQNQLSQIFYYINALTYLLMGYGIICLTWKRN